MQYMIKELRLSTGMTQKRFAEYFGIPLSTLRKWEQGEAAPAVYITEMIARLLPYSDKNLKKIKGKHGSDYFYDQNKKAVLDKLGNQIRISEDLEGVNQQNLGLYLDDLFEDFYKIQAKFSRDCYYDKEENILWS